MVFGVTNKMTKNDPKWLLGLSHFVIFQLCPLCHAYLNPPLPRSPQDPPQILPRSSRDPPEILPRSSRDPPQISPRSSRSRSITFRAGQLVSSTLHRPHTDNIWINIQKSFSFSIQSCYCYFEWWLWESHFVLRVGGMRRQAFKSAALLAAPCGVTDHV